MRARPVVAAFVAAALGAGLVWYVAPDIGPPVTAPAPVTPRASRARQAGPAALPAAAEGPVRAGAQIGEANAPEGPPPRPAPPPIDRAAEQPAAPNGLTFAAYARAPELTTCWDDWVAEHDDHGGQLIVELALERAGDGQRVTARYPTPLGGAEDLDACMQAAFADARFAPLDGPEVRVRWKVPSSR